MSASKPRILTHSTPAYRAVAIVWPRGALGAMLGRVWPTIAQVIVIGGTLAAIHYFAG
jgi:hypothetical protein